MLTSKFEELRVGVFLRNPTRYDLSMIYTIRIWNCQPNMSLGQHFLRRALVCLNLRILEKIINMC